MNSRQRFSYEVPIEKQHYVELDNTPKSDDTEDQDCVIIEPEKSQKTNPYPNKNNELAGVLENYTMKTPVVIDDLVTDDDCTIIENQIQKNKKNHSKHTNTNKSNQNTFMSNATAAYYNSMNLSGKTQEHRAQNYCDNRQIVVIKELTDDEDSEGENDCSIVEQNRISQVYQLKNNKPFNDTVNLDRIYGQDKLLAELLETFLNTENSSGMVRIINRSVIPTYNKTCEGFKHSEFFQKMLKQTICRLNTEPNRKYTHLKQLCELMKCSVASDQQCKRQLDKNTHKNKKEKKRIQLTTLKRKLHGKFTSDKTKSSNKLPKTMTNGVIDLDDDDDDDVILNGDSVIPINNPRCEAVKTTNVLSNKHKSHAETYTVDNIDVEMRDEENGNEIDDETSEQSKTDDETNEHNELDDDVIFVGADAVGLLRPTSHVTVLSEDKIKQKIVDIEVKIKYYYDLIEKLELQEVDWDSNDNSPYLQSEVYKTKVISLYKHLCELSGTDSVKRHKVRLKVVQGRHEGPVRCLEEFINDNIDEDGNPPFPDMVDVTKCVRKANIRDKLGWTKRQIEMEAQSLFFHYGRTAQKRRQKREWRDLMHYVKEEVVDPADEDPTLQARLHENAKLASRNEKNLLDRYAQMESNIKPDRMSNSGIELSVSDSDETSSVSEETVANCDNVLLNSATIPNSATVSNSVIVSNSGTISNNTAVFNNRTVSNRATVNYTDTVLNSAAISSSSATLPNCATMLNNANVFNNTITLNSNKTSRDDQITGNQVNHDPSNVVVNQLIVPPEVAKYPIQYIVVDDNMKPVAFIVNKESEPIPNLATVIREITENPKREEPNSSNMVDSTVQRYENGAKLDEINNQTIPELENKGTALIENSRVTTVNPVVGSNNNFESRSNKHCQGCIETNKDPNYGYYTVNNKSVQYNEVSTNSEDDIITINDVLDKNLPENSKASKSSKVCAKTCGVVNKKISENVCKTVNDTKPTSNGGKTCGLRNRVSSRDGVEIHNSVNDIGPVDSDNTYCESETDEGTSNIGDKTISETSDKTIEDKQSKENRSKSCELPNDTTSAIGDKTDGIVNDAGSNCDLNETVIKKEKLDIPSLLEALGDNYTVTIISIEDPFEVIEISDSSDSEDDS